MLIKNNFLGETVLEIPQKYIDKVALPDFRSFHHVEERDIINGKENVGSMIIAVQLAAVCTL